MHTREKKYDCSWPGCDAKYARLKGLKIHLMKHRGEKPNECETCGKKFRQKDNLKRHYQTHFKEKKLSNSSNVSNKLELELEKTLTLVL